MSRNGSVLRDRGDWFKIGAWSVGAGPRPELAPKAREPEVPARQRAGAATIFAWTAVWPLIMPPTSVGGAVQHPPTIREPDTDRAFPSSGNARML